MSMNLFWRPTRAEQRREPFSYFVKRLVDGQWGIPCVLAEYSLEVLNAWALFASTMGGGDWADLARELKEIAGLVEKHGRIELYEE